MRTPIEKTKNSIDILKREMKKIYDEKILPFIYLKRDLLSSRLKETDYAMADLVNDFFKTTHEWDAFMDDYWKCQSINWDKLECLKHNNHEYNYSLNEAKLDYELIKMFGDTCVQLMDYYYKNKDTAKLTKHPMKALDRRTEMYEKIGESHKYPRNLRPPMSQGRLYGEKTCAPQRKRAAPKKRATAVKVNVRKMF